MTARQGSDLDRGSPGPNACLFRRFVDLTYGQPFLPPINSSLGSRVPTGKDGSCHRLSQRHSRLAGCSTSTGIAGRHARNGSSECPDEWSECSGMRGRVAPESVVDFHRIRGSASAVLTGSRLPRHECTARHLPRRLFPGLRRSSSSRGAERSASKFLRPTRGTLSTGLVRECR